jgi:uncharacterized repeat protein (TIGR01451 family)
MNAQSITCLSSVNECDWYMKISKQRLLLRWKGLFRWPLWLGLTMALLPIASVSRADGLSDSVRQQIAALEAEKATRTPAQLKLDSQLIYAWKHAQALPYAQGITNLQLAVTVNTDGQAHVDMDTEVTGALLDAIAKAGGTVEFSSPTFRSIRAWLPLAQVENLASRPEVKFIRPAVPVATSTGSVDSEGDVTHRALDGRANFLTDGFGVNVGVISDSIDFLAAAQATGDLPADLVVLPGQSGIPATGEGNAMCQIVYDLAPAAGLFFATGDGGPANFAQNILSLRAAGCDIIVDDLIYANESPFQDAIVAQAVNSVTADGAMYFSSAGNEGNALKGTSGTWEGDFVDGGAAGTPVNGKGGNVHMFGSNVFNRVTVPGGWAALFWSDPLGASTNDYDLYVLDTNGTTVVFSSTTVQNGSQDPFEMTPGPDVGEQIVIVKATGDPRFLWLNNFRGELEIATNGYVHGHNSATNAFAVAATDIHNSFPNAFTGGPANPVEGFSGDGPRQVFYNADGTPITPTNFLSTGGFVRQKPDITAADGVSTTLAAFTPFFGTSAAAPHAAAIAALLKSYNPVLSNRQIRNLMTGNAFDIEAQGFDINSGSGIVMAFQSLESSPLPAPFPRLVITTNYLSGGNGNGIIDFNECNNLDLVLTNIGRAGGTHIRGTLSTTTPGVTIAQPTVPYPDIPVGGAGTNLISFKVSTAPNFNCGIPVQFSLVLKSDQNTFTNQFTLPTGVPGIPLRFDNNFPVPIPDVGVAYSPIAITNVNNALNKLTVSLHITHTFDADLLIQLISPDGTTNTLSANHGSFGQNYGFSCSPDPARTIFDDSATTPISFATAPFVGTFLPDQPLSIFAGKAGTNLNGIWLLRVQDVAPLDVGTIQCWSMTLTPTICVDGGGECPGSDLALGMTALPEPVIIGSFLTYTISVTNNGPSLANNVVVSHVLPPNAVFVSATLSQGGYSQSGGVVTCNLGPMSSKGTATINVVVLPATPGFVSSSASVSSEQPDFNPDNNTVTVFSHVNPPTADLLVGLVGAPDPNVVGGLLTYTATVTNNGPSSASGVVLTNVLPSSVIIRSALVSQGSVNILGNIVLCNLGGLTNGGVATATIQVTPTASGLLTATATAAGNQFDPITTNNIAVATTSIGAAADLALSVIDTPDPVVAQSNLTYQISVTNFGPSTATSVVLNHSLPVSATVVSMTTSQGSISQSGNTVSANLGTLTNGQSALVTIVVIPNLNGPFVATAVVSGAQADPFTGNNSVTVSTQVAPPFVAIAAAGASLLKESFSPTNGAVDIGETVTVSLRLQNAGNINNTNLVATLLATNGVAPVPPNAPQAYGVLKPSSLPVGRSFSFTASGTNGQTITAFLHLQDGAADLGVVGFNFTLPNSFTFANTNAIAILDDTAASIYPSVISVPAITGIVGKVTVTLSNISHTFPQDIDALLVGPQGQNTILMSGAGAPPLDSADVTFDDGAPTPIPNATSQILTASYQPASYLPNLSLPAPAPSAPYLASLSVFNSVNPLGDWSLYVDDHTIGDTGSIDGGWSLTLTMITPVNQLADVGIVGSASPNPAVVSGLLTYTFTVTNAGPDTANFVTFTNTLPAGATPVSATASQGTLVTNATTVGGVLGSLSVGTNIIVTVVVSPGIGGAGHLTSVASVAATETDLNPANNTASVNSTANLPTADLGLSQQVSPDPGVAGQKQTYTLAVTNRGPGAALNTVLTNTLPANLAFVSVTTSSGTSSHQGNTVVCQFGDLAPNSAASATIVAVPSTIGSFTNSATVSTVSTDLNPIDNSSSLVSSAANPAPIVVPAGALLMAESGVPPDGAIEPGETVTISFGLTNIGSAATSNLVATLQPTGGITQPSGAQTYGVLANGGTASSRPFSFTVAPAASGTVTATLQLHDGEHTIGTAAYTFTLPTVSSFANANGITIPNRGQGSPYPSSIAISGLNNGLVTKVRVTLNGLSHSFPHDVNVLLVSPSGASTLLMSHTGGGHALTNATLTFDDGATASLPNFGAITPGSFKPSSYETPVVFPRPAPAGDYGKTLSALNARDPNGLWSLYVLDDATGDDGIITSGWALEITTATTVNPVADLVVGLSSAPASLYVGGVVNNTITVTNLGPSPATGVIVTNILPLGVNFVSSSPPGTFVGTSGGLVTVNLGTLPVGSGATVTVVAAPTVGVTILNSATVGGNELDLNPANNSAQTSTTVISPALPVVDGTVINGQFHLLVTAQPGLPYVISGSTNLTSWIPLSTNTADSAGLIKYVDPDSPGISHRFYRAARLLP